MKYHSIDCAAVQPLARGECTCGASETVDCDECEGRGYYRVTDGVIQKLTTCKKCNGSGQVKNRE